MSYYGRDNRGLTGGDGWDHLDDDHDDHDDWDFGYGEWARDGEEQNTDPTFDFFDELFPPLEQESTRRTSPSSSFNAPPPRAVGQQLPRQTLPRSHPRARAGDPLVAARVTTPRTDIRPLIDLNREPDHEPERDVTTQRSYFGYVPEHLFSPLSDEEVSPTSQSLDDYIGNFAVLEDSSSNNTQPPSMTSVRSRNRLGRDNTSGPIPDPIETPTGGTKRKAEVNSSIGATRATKRRGSAKWEEVEEIDLASGASSAKKESLPPDREEAINSQQAALNDQIPQRIGQRQCIICLDNYTNCTATACGHFYCHECLVRSLMAGEKNSDRGVGTCPNCRKPLQRNRRAINIIPIQFMKKEQFAENQRKRTDL